MSRTPRPQNASRLTRRRLLRATGAAAALGAAGGLGLTLAGHAGRYVQASPACPLRYFTRREYRIVLDLSDTMFPEGNALGITGREARVPEYLDHMLAGMRADKATELRAMFLLFEHGTLAFGLRTRRFTELTPVARERYLRHWERSQVYSRRMLIAGLKAFLGMAYFAHPAVRERLGIQHVCSSAADAMPREEWS